jgi:thioredoxin-dependent peroxiredoxin
MFQRGTRNNAMIDLPKATKGRRMSKKTRTKSPKTASAKAARTSPKKSGSGAGRTAAKKALQKSPGKAATASHKAPSKQLKTAAAAKPATANSQRNADPAAPPLKSTLREGAKAPAFHLPRDGGDTVSLADYPGKKLVIFFYPRADTPGCTKEALDFTRLADDFADAQTAVLGVSADPLPAQQAFRDRHQLSIPLLSDESHKVLQAYGVWGEKSMYGRTFLGILRTTVLIGTDGRVARIWRNVKVDGHADEVLKVVRAL